jgi:hypothetical protein
MYQQKFLKMHGLNTKNKTDDYYVLISLTTGCFFIYPANKKYLQINQILFD